MAKFYETGFYFKQGEDFNFHLDQCNGNLTDALKSWSGHLEGASKAMLRLSELFIDKDIKVTADGPMVNFSGDEEVLNKAVEEEILNAWDEKELESELEEQDYTCNCGNCCDTDDEEDFIFPEKEESDVSGNS